MKHPMEDTSLFAIELINKLVEEHMQANTGKRDGRHRSRLDEDRKHVGHNSQHQCDQRILNPTILDIVKKEVTKLLTAGIIYPISDSN
ncbi:hypothetical protein CR513_32092, partial [Mucuna pruriens]